MCSNRGEKIDFNWFSIGWREAGTEQRAAEDFTSEG